MINPRRTKRFFENRSHLLAFADLESTAGLEIGAHDLALVEPQEGNCEYADFRNFDELVALAARQEGHNAQFVVPVQYDLRNGYDQITKTYDWIAASHVVEHVPDLAGWLQTLASKLNPDGFVFLVVPDKRFTFDRHRRLTNLTDVITAHREKLTTPSFRQVFDHYYYSSDWQHPQYAWVNGQLPPANRNFAGSLAIAERAIDEYEDAHCSVFTPESFAELIYQMFACGVSPFYLADMRPTAFNELDFTAVLKI